MKNNLAQFLAKRAELSPRPPRADRGGLARVAEADGHRSNDMAMASRDALTRPWRMWNPRATGAANDGGGTR